MLVRRKHQYYLAMIQAGWAMPTESSAVCTMQWMHGVRNRIFYCPRLSDLKPQVVCLHPPPKTVLLDKIETTTNQQFEE